MGIFTQWWRARRKSAANAAFSHAPAGRASEQARLEGLLDASHAELELVNSQLKLYLDRAPLACVVWGQDQIVRMWNPAAESLFGYSAAEAIGRNVYELTATPESLEIVDEIREKVLSGAEYPDALVLENRRRDGSHLHCEWHFAVVGEPSLGRGVIAFGVDVTAKLRAEEERQLFEANLRQAQKMQSLGTLAGGIAHDFNNILLAISGNAKLAADDLPTDHQAQVSLAEIVKASARASGIVSQILTFSRSEETVHAPVDLREIIEEAANLMRAALPLKVSIRTRCAPAAPLVLGDAVQIHQVMLNLAANAAHSMSDSGGTIDIDLEQLDLDDATEGPPNTLSPGRYYRIGVHDTGIGIRQEVIDRIFEPFFTTKPRGQGTGLGLSVVHGIIKAHGGAITVRSAPGAGSTFHVYLPVMSSEAQNGTAPLPPIPQGLGQSILYVDDEEPLVYLITRVLERLGYRVAGFTDANKALHAFETDPDAYEAVITDLSMPGMSGEELAKLVLQIRPQVPVVMTSGYVRPEDRQSALATGVRELLLKPNTVEELGEVLHRLLSATRAG
jgi:PAS domain S-box-containing protein